MIQVLHCPLYLVVSEGTQVTEETSGEFHKRPNAGPVSHVYGDLACETKLTCSKTLEGCN